ncbi:MAG: NAD(P)-dependent oxidoreductase [Armatimonadetes bacterium]|nr:NAD(P)-dependent oxidoreductase [Armatimonadota bacterium]
MKVFVTGGTGYFGAHLARELVAGGHEVTVLARNLAKAPRLPGVKVVQGDLLKFEEAALDGHQALIHNALIWDERPTELEMKDTRAAAKLFEAAGKCGIEQVIYSSAVAVHRPFLPKMNEDSPIRPADYYGATKAAGETFLWAASHQFNIRCNAIRLGPVVGAPGLEGAPFKSHSQFFEIANGALAGGEIVVTKGDGRQFVSAQDAAKVYRALLESDLNRQALLCTDKEPTTWESIARLSVELCGSRSRVVVEEKPVPQGHFDVSKLKKELGFTLDSSDAMRGHIESVLHSLK